MELKKYLDKYNIIGVLSDYKVSLRSDKKVSEILKSKNNCQLLKFLNLEENLLEKDIKDLSLSELIKIDLLSKVNNEVIITGGFTNNLVYKDRELVSKFLLKLSNNFNKKIIIIDGNIESLMNVCKYFIIIKNNKILYKTTNVYDENLYKYINKPEIINFVLQAKENGIQLDNYTDIHELLKAIYRSI